MRLHSAFALLFLSALARAQTFTLDASGPRATIVRPDQVTTRLAADLLGRDLQRVGGGLPSQASRLADCPHRCIVIGTADSPEVRATARILGIDLAPLGGQRERYLRAAGTAAGRPVLLIAGSDPRGAIYGVVDATRELGVSAWEWWADVAPPARASVTLAGAYRLSAAPSVAWRGIFINDEDWGLQPWAARTFDASGDIGPATYARVFELMWRLKANLIWPAMHDSTTAFYKMPGNAQAARDYAIAVGTSHAEPMMRNNVGEWDKSFGPFNFFTNRARMERYWRERIDAVKDFENVYTLGLRGVHDSAMEGAAGPEQARAALEDVFTLQRAILARSVGRPPTRIPQVFTMYKEVLDYYNQGLRVPEDATLVWPDDNYGYLHQLGGPREQARAGGNGIYYHISYWGRPHDYLWLGSTSPALMRDQLQRAWTQEARRTWVVNVGDIKPHEYLTQYFLDAAFDAQVLRQDPQRHLRDWAARQFGDAHAEEIAAVLQEYYRLAWERRPEFMGWSQTEPTRPVRPTDYVRSGGEEAERRLERYRAVVARAEALRARVPEALGAAYFQLVLYPVRSAANLNTRILKLDLAAEYVRQQRPAANLYAAQAHAAHAALVADAAAYNGLADGKWTHMMDIAPRRLPVFAEPVYPSWSASPRRGCGIVYPALHSAESDRLVLRQGRESRRSVTLVSYGQEPLRWSVAPGARSVQAHADAGELNAANGFETRIAFDYDGGAQPALSLRCGGQILEVKLLAQAVGDERERIVVLPAARAALTPDWEVQPGLGTSGQALRARLDLAPREPGAPAEPLVYRFETAIDAGATLRFVAVPVHPLTAAHRVRIAVSLDGGPAALLDYTTVGRSDEWKRNVLANMALRTMNVARLAPGAHTLRVWPLDPGVVLDRIDVVFDGAPDYYGMPPSD